jgi:hypothetical protein
VGESSKGDLSAHEIMIRNSPAPGLWLAPSCILPRKRGRK